MVWVGSTSPGRWGAEAFVFQVPGDRDRAGVQSVRGQLTVHLDDPVRYLIGGVVGLVCGALKRGSSASRTPWR